MDDLAAWLRAQLDEDERVAQAADSGRWLPEDKGITFEYSADDFHEGEAQARLVADTRANQEHIAEWGPYRVLREVESKRRLIEQIGYYESKIDGEWGCCHDGAAILAGRCPDIAVGEIAALRVLALPYADREGFREEWRP